jgi:hypothetical protein
LSRNPNYHQLVMEQIMAGTNPSAKKLRHEMTHSLAERLAAVLTEGQRSGEMREVDARMLAIAVIGMTEFFGSGWAVVEQLFPNADRDELAEQYARFAGEFITAALAQGNILSKGKGTA